MKTIHSFGTSLEYHIIMQIKATLPSGRVRLKRTNHILKRYRRKLCKFCKNMLADLKKRHNVLNPLDKSQKTFG